MADSRKQEDENDWDACARKAVDILTKAKGVEDLGIGDIKVEMIAYDRCVTKVSARKWKICPAPRDLCITTHVTAPGRAMQRVYICM